jgi:hypothetical protein
MKQGLTVSKLEDKKEHRLKAMMTKYISRIAKLESILKNAKTFNIPLSIITENAITDKIVFYRKELYKINDMWNVKYNDKYKGSLSNWSKLHKYK